MALSTAAGLAMGVMAGLVAGASVGRVSSDRVRRVVGRLRSARSAEPPQDPGTVERAVSAALEENPTTRDLTISVRGLGDGVVELTGTAPDPTARRLAGKLARGVPGADVVVNRVLVEGDDVPRRKSAPSSAS
ncbi:MAG: BON domain-containing protein [Gemmatimonadales bacterium]|nr:BON domain-containing protein [Gemmatimonadales bacterium]NIN10831.1 BON domain-containing protein [Gemmatimonadales bacterium]NIN49474.1 BON domain-containing protein [Gemmatimonadales bacterium]NIP06938.1 BON domain-containing protein [Gemmatimonadales bacterium]NIR01614.1 BON domain-containing protein [Gemmatimonadales bacterium]